MRPTLSRPRRAILALGIALVAVSLAGEGTNVSQASSFAVDSTLDAVDADPGDGTCATAAGACTLRAAVQEANALNGPDAISLPAGIYELTLAGAGEDGAATGDLDITSGLTITGVDGASVTAIDGAGLDRVFDIGPAAAGIDVQISGVTVRNGDAAVGGGIVSSGATVTLADSVVSGNTASGGGGIVNQGDGTMRLTNVTVSGNAASVAGGIRNNGTIELLDSIVQANEAADDGGAVVNHGTLTAVATDFSDNTSGDNGGAFWGDGVLDLSGCTVSGNTAADEGGSIVNFGGGVVTLTDTIVSGNSALSARGGIVNFGGSAMTLTNVTVSGNSAHDVGGGIHNGGTLTLRSSTLSSNSSDDAGGGIHNAGTASIENTLFAGNSPDNCAGASVTSEGHNLDDGDTCGFAAAGDVTTTNAQLGPLQDNGGPTHTHALLPGSPAIDAGSEHCPPPAADQRGVTRPQGTACDIGAYEFESPTPTFVGDVDCNGAVNSIDAALVLQVDAGLVASLVCQDAADANQDGSINSIDAALVLQFTAGLIPTLPPP